jgi:hypothetical protein
MIQSILSALRAAFREGLREFKRKQHGKHITDPFQL